MTKTWPIRFALPLLLLALTASGCVAGGAVLYKVFGPAAVDAKYEPQKRSTLVLVENFGDPDASAVDGDSVARQVGEALHDHAGLTVVDPDQVLPLRAESPADFRELTVPAVGQKVGAEQVVYVNLIESQTTSDPTGAAVTATATARVRVVDVATGEVLWPRGQPKGYELSAKMPYDRTDSATGTAMRAHLVNRLSEEIGHLFYSWKPDSEQEPTAGA